VIVTDPPNTRTTEASIGIVARPCRRTRSGLCGKGVPGGVPAAAPADTC
jgi:hypothetical protein